MAVDLPDLIGAIAVQAAAVADSVLSSLFALYSAGAPGGLDVGPLLAGGGAAAAAGAGAASGAASGTTGSGTEDGTSGGSDVGRNDSTRPRVPSSVQARRDRQANPTFGDRVSQQFVDVVTTTGDWAESLVQDGAIFGYKKGQAGYGFDPTGGGPPQV